MKSVKLIGLAIGASLALSTAALAQGITIETGGADRLANMHAFAARALTLLLENVSQ